MITKVYAHILDEDRKMNAQKFETAFYANPDLREVKAPRETEQNTKIDLPTLMAELKKSPELLESLKLLLNEQKSLCEIVISKTHYFISKVLKVVRFPISKKYK